MQSCSITPNINQACIAATNVVLNLPPRFDKAKQHYDNHDQNKSLLSLIGL